MEGIILRHWLLPGGVRANTPQCTLAHLSPPAFSSIMAGAGAGPQFDRT
jgi:hypothetical protein